jgi:hypothetical protein
MKLVWMFQIEHLNIVPSLYLNSIEICESKPYIYVLNGKVLLKYIYEINI